MYTKRSLAILLMLCFALFSGCRSESIPSVKDDFRESSIYEDVGSDTFKPDASIPEEPAGTDSEFFTKPVPETSETNAGTTPGSQDDSTTEAEPSGTQSEPAKPVNPPSTDTPEPTTLPEVSEPERPPYTDPPESSVSSELTTSPEDALVPGKQYHDPESDPYGVVVLIRSYADDRGFELHESLTIENSGYRGHPNVTDWTLDGVIETLKYHVDKLLEIQGPGYYNVVYRVYQGKLEYYFLVQ